MSSGKKSPFSRTAGHIFVSPGDAPATITQYVAWMQRQFSACQIPRSIVSTYLQQFPSYSNCKCQKSPFSRTAAHIFVSPGDTPAIITQYVARMERQFNACQTPSSINPSIFNSFPVIRTANAKKSVSPGDAKCCMNGKRIRCLQIVSLNVPNAHLTITVSEIDRDIGRKSSIFHTPLGPFYSTPP